MIYKSTNVQSAASQKHLGLILNSKLDFSDYIDSKANKGNKVIGLTEKLSLTLSRKRLLKICKSFRRSNLVYADI